MSRRLVMFGLLAVSALSTGCFPCVHKRMACRWQLHHGIGCGPVCAPACGPVCNATPAFRIPSPVVGMPVAGVPIGAPGCSTCTTGVDAGPMGYAMPVAGPGYVGAPPIIGPAMPLGAPRIEAPMTNGAPKN
ncbi:hypothetical protein [Urbifossiella limnaea]|uniref:Uncharacterized protein n=1 Tax=Urbifossiella limnaea TaxID=2528023 RepID=A0A517XPM0_9BACT|nr:hypothetical protein [Urbifossiella limnaea]QDU19455.1 hypothetical protein ETAA1_13800 [Urbifossiella limnaea]